MTHVLMKHKLCFMWESVADLGFISSYTHLCYNFIQTFDKTRLLIIFLDKSVGFIGRAWSRHSFLKIVKIPLLENQSGLGRNGETVSAHSQNQSCVCAWRQCIYSHSKLAAMVGPLEFTFAKIQGSKILLLEFVGSKYKYLVTMLLLKHPNFEPWYLIFN